MSTLASLAGARRPASPLAPAALLAAALLAGCATPQNPDPLESVNRKTFALNEGVDKVVLKPVATVYKAVLPTPVRTGVSNFFSNLGDPWSGVNLMLQGRFKAGFSDFARFGTNSTVGLLGVMDVATDWGLPRHGDGFSDTLGAWGVGGGAYLVLPIFGPSDLRGTASIPVNSFGNLAGYLDDAGARNALMIVNIVDKRAGMLELTKTIDEIALDKYLFVRDAYLQRRTQRETERSAKPAPADGPT
ncbi:VacJ family lipoprotein [Mitsuaria sp. GD03876]|uniref:MlaA family lipoprotein n=1 Tax=Mitsuaria sp. GD03876 TaxID=2975399 RepID=UPI00244BD48E|nr:VacJ family lipoprotein [Mitsuaria sp. GD03876]MDH0864695.1 VacJ family lipoprotein [Mitsuaria sp. GD03876]